MSPRFVIRAGRAVTPDGVLERATLVVEEGRIVSLSAAPPPAGLETIEAGALTLLPGFVDVHIHGGAGCDTMDATPEALQAIARVHARHGTTGFLATTMTQSRAAIEAALANARAAVEKGPAFCADGAQVLGIHLEGPYIHPARPGAQPKEFVRDYLPEEFAGWLEIAGGALRLITLAPERPGGHPLIAACRRAGIVVSMGHTDASSAETQEALAAGVQHATHLFNAMPSIHHRQPGPIPTLLTDPRARVEIIADGHHVAPDVVGMILAAKGARGVLAVTDAMAGAGAGEGVYALGGLAVTVAEGRATLADGTLAGSVLTMDRAAANLRAWGGLDWEEVARVSATNAADQLGLTAKGRLAPGADADLVLVDDDLSVHATFVAGRCVYHAGTIPALAEAETAPVETLFQQLDDRSAPVRIAAAQRLAALREPAVTERLLAGIRSENFRIRRAAADALGQTGEPAVPGLIACLQERPEVRAAAIAALGQVGAPAIAALRAELSASGVRARRAALEALERLRPTIPAELFLPHLSAPDPEERWRAAAVLGNLNDLQVVPALAARFADDVPQVRWSVATALGTLAAHSALRALLTQLSDPDASVRSAVAWALGEVQDQQALGPLQRLLDHDPEMSVRHAALLALGRLGSEEATDALISRLETSDDMERALLIEALGQLGPEGRDRLRASRDRLSPAARAAADEAIGRIG